MILCVPSMQLALGQGVLTFHAVGALCPAFLLTLLEMLSFVLRASLLTVLSFLLLSHFFRLLGKRWTCLALYLMNSCEKKKVLCAYKVSYISSVI